MEAGELLQAISAGVVDDHFEAVYDAIKARRKVLTNISALAFKPGLAVRVGRITPKVLDGIEGVIVEKVRTRGSKRWVFKPNEEDASKVAQYLTMDGTLNLLPQCLEPIGS